MRICITITIPTLFKDVPVSEEDPSGVTALRVHSFNVTVHSLVKVICNAAISNKAGHMVTPRHYYDLTCKVTAENKVCILPLYTWQLRGLCNRFWTP